MHLISTKFARRLRFGVRPPGVESIDAIGLDGVNARSHMAVGWVQGNRGLSMNNLTEGRDGVGFCSFNVSFDVAI